MKNKYIISISFVLFIFSYFKGKTQDTLQINEVIKNESRQNLYKNSNEEVIDSITKSFYKNTSIDELLAIQTSSQIQSYGGLGNLSSISIRGCSANHVSVNWNGFPVNSKTTGTTDLSLIKSGFFEEIKIIPGASSSLYGSGTFGGAVELNNFSFNKKGLSANSGSEIGSFNSYKYFFQGNYSNNYLDYKISVNKTNSKNNFPFYNNYKIDKPIERREHNKLSSFNLIQNIKVKLAKNNSIESGIWFIFKDKEIPEIAGSYNEGSKIQTDSIFRTFLRWKKLYKKSLLTLSSAYFFEYLHYTDKINPNDNYFAVNSEIFSNTFLEDISYRHYFSDKLTFEIAGIINYQQISTSNYTYSKTDEINYSILSFLKYKILKYDLSLSFRNEFSEPIGYIPLFDLGISGKFLKDKIIIKSSISNKFRRPTFNEKYWQPGGNQNIKTETGENAEVSLKYYFKEKKINNISITGYYSKIQNMIQWILVEGIWIAENNKEVQISGIEANTHYLIKNNNFKYSLIASYNFTNSLLTKIYSNNEIELPLNLIYTPKHSSKLFFSVSHKKLNISVSNQYIGNKFTTQDNNIESILPAIFLSNFYISYQFNFKNININLNTKILNIFNKQYEIIKSYPSPGRAFYFGIEISYKKQ